MRRREFLTLLGGAAAGWPLAARARQPTTQVIGFLGSESPELSVSRLNAFRESLSETGFVEGRNIEIEYRWAEGQNDRLSALAADLVGHQVKAIAAGGSPAALAAKAATATIPVVFVTGGDPVAGGLVASLKQPGGNLTGVTSLAVEAGPKQLELLHELVPTATDLFLLVNPTNPTLAEPLTKDLQAAAETLKLRLRVLQASTESDLETAFALIRRTRAAGLVIGNDAFFNARAEQLGELVLHYAVPTVFQFREFAAAGGLASYGGSVTEWAGRALCQPDTQGREAYRTAGAAVHETTADHQSQDRQGAWDHCAAVAARPRRRDHRTRS
jgi:putative tryptophan/tyrosine transport system substrate-binding protein